MDYEHLLIIKLMSWSTLKKLDGGWFMGGWKELGWSLCVFQNVKVVVTLMV